MPSFLDIPRLPHPKQTHTEVLVLKLLAHSSLFSLHLTRTFHCTHENFQNLHALSKLVLHHWDLRYKEVYIQMAVADLIAAWLLPFIAPIILYFARQYAIRKGWLSAPSNPPNDIDCQTLDALNAVLDALRGIDRNISRHRQESVASLNGIKESLDRLTELSEAREMDGGMLIHQRVPTPHVPSAAVHLDG